MFTARYGLGLYMCFRLIFRLPSAEAPFADLPIYTFYAYCLLNLFSFVPLTSSFDALFHVHLQGCPCS